MRHASFDLMVGDTPVVQFRSKDLPGAAQLWVKLEAYNPTGSVKDRGCVSNIRDAIARGVLKPGKTILDASSGNMACALAYFGRAMGYPVTVVCSSKLTSDKAAFIKLFGAELIRHGDLTIEGNRLCRDEIAPSDPDRYCFLDQLHNWANPQASYDTMGPELLRDFPDLAAVAGSLGSGGTMYGTARFLRDKASRAIVIATEASSGTKLPGVGGFDDGDYITPFIAKATDEKLFDCKPKIGFADAVARTRELTEQGFFVGLQTGAVVAAAIQTARERDIRGDMVAISGDSGWKNMEVLGAELCGMKLG